ncbi:MAG: 50S ribosomal protein L5 [Candidatus Woykebacteria bacterium RIFCSPLOWO2_01_FULL_41_12]|uniref:Large ribosomal subunit protein uL5 n=2 Tax=Microgenomates group TaxID=1794810 RepID=A0A0H4TLT2_9BACT|nr:50S ribosomal protein L5, large subunit ribosomal protein L5 [uncultured Microgenomates bacterium Rifle_16ft_4_minimus_19697]OGY30570.1 MAG: 50S ribosomal protein L5 [Candidatus Woykebacteria bacterium RIFCSPLOWO2_01_FULL_41_12]
MIDQAGSLKLKYFKEIRPKLRESLGKKNIHEPPRLEKIVINVGFGKGNPDQKQKEQIISRLAAVTGQNPVLTKARIAIAGFKIRKGQVIGAKVTLRNTKMYDFFEKLVSIVIPRLRDFRGMGLGSFDGRGNYTIGFREINVFPEVEYTRGEKTFGLEVVICTSTGNNDEAKMLLTELGMPFKKENTNRKKEVVVNKV